jgi:hypothetical protein
MCGSCSAARTEAPCEPRQWEQETNYKCSKGAQVEAMEVVIAAVWRQREHIRQVEIALADDEKIDQHDSDDRALEDAVTTEESQKAIARGYNAPGDGQFLGTPFR